MVVIVVGVFSLLLKWSHNNNADTEECCWMHSNESKRVNVHQIFSSTNICSGFPDKNDQKYWLAKLVDAVMQ